MSNYLKQRDRLLSDMMISERQAIVARLYMVEDMTQMEIAQELGVSQSTISKDVAKIHEEFKMRQTLPLQWYKEQQLQKLNAIEKAAREGWERSIGKSTRVVEKSSLDNNNQLVITEKVETTDELPGDPRFLNQMIACVDRRIRILGLDEPQELIINTLEGRLTKLIKEGRVTFDMLENDVGRQQALKFFNIAGMEVPDIIEGYTVGEEEEDEYRFEADE